jgi:hypothetical protein
MTIARQFELHKIQFVQIEASNPLDEIFLASFLHRSYPDAELVLGSDLLMTRDIDNAPFVGSISLGPYHLMGIRGGGAASRTYADSSSVAEYNAGEYTFWQVSPFKKRTGTSVCSPDPPGNSLASHEPLKSPDQWPELKYYLCLSPNKPPQLPLWATTVGRDGYYPLGVLRFSSSDLPEFVPRIEADKEPLDQDTADSVDLAKNYLLGLKKDTRIYPSIAWYFLSWLVMILCAGHILLVCVANYWSPLTRDLAVCDSDKPNRRSIYIHSSAAALALMAWALSCPVVISRIRVQINDWGEIIGASMLILTIMVAVVTFAKTIGCFSWSKAQDNDEARKNRREQTICLWLISVIWFLAIVWALIWAWLCRADLGWLAASYLEGISFSYRCIHPTSGVSPVLPVLLLLLGWYLWGIIETWRLRFSENGRPHLSDDAGGKLDRRFVVTDEDLGGGVENPCIESSELTAPLYANIESPVFIFRLLQRVPECESFRIKAAILAGGAILFLSLAISGPFRGLGHFLWSTKPWPFLSSPDEFLVALLIFPLLGVAFAGWLRLVFVWGTLKKGLLSRLEDQPIRFAFSRLHGMGWMTMLRRVGWLEQWRDMDRCIESMCQMLHHPDFAGNLKSEELQALSANCREILKKHETLRERRLGKVPKKSVPDFELLNELDSELAAFGRELLENLLIPFWESERVGLVESEGFDEVPITARRTDLVGSHPHIPMELQAGPASDEPARIILAEEFIAIRYMSLIRAVLANLRYSMTFVSTAFVLTIVAWNSYPFQPHQIVDWAFTGILLILGLGVTRVFAQMHRDPILSRVTNTKPNELGLDFYVRIIAFGTLPVLTWLAYEFPDIGSAIYRFVQPGASVFR